MLPEIAPVSPPFSKYWPPVALTTPPWAALRRMMLTTPAMASEPYLGAAPPPGGGVGRVVLAAPGGGVGPVWAAAAACSPSAGSVGPAGNRPRSGVAAPWKTPGATCRLPVECRRLPLTSTRVLFGLRP